MTFPYRTDIRLAIRVIRSAKIRSFFTVLGIVVGVVSVISVVAIAQGVKNQISSQVDSLGKDLITIRPSQVSANSNSGFIFGINIFGGVANSSSLTHDDVSRLQNVPQIKNVVPLSAVNGDISVDGQKNSPQLIVGTNEQFSQILNQKVAFGQFFDENDINKPVAVLGQNLAQKIFGENVPLGRSFEYRNQNFIVVGILNNFDASPLSADLDFNNVLFIPDPTLQSLTSNSTSIYEILIKPGSSQNLDNVYNLTNQILINSHKGQSDFVVLRQSESLKVSNGILKQLTTLIIGIAGISLLVGGIGIMNVMLVTVTDRTREIGIRKAIGATNKQIMLQFLIEAIVLSLIGGFIGVLFAFIVDYGIRILTSLQPDITWQIVALATGIAVILGTIFGAIPAIQAARKDPIDSLRYE
jgi:putative ABC transport system permease protein